MSYIGNKITGFLGSGALTVTTSTVTVEDDALFSADGNTIIGNESSDTLTIKANTVAIPNNLNFDSNTFFLDASNNRVGIGTSSPVAPLHIFTSNSTVSRLVGTNANGTSFGIGNTTTGAAHLYIDGSNGDFAGADYVKLIQKNDLSGELSNVGANPLLFSTTNTERMRITSAGQVGIGTSSPNANLGFPIGNDIKISQVAGAAHQSGNAGSIGLTISDGGNHSGVFVNNSHDGTYSDQFITFNTAEGGISASTERMRITSSGNVGIGTSSPSTYLHVYGSAPELRVQSTATNNGFIRFINTSGSMSVGMSGSAANQFLLYDRTNSHTAYLYVGGASGSHTWRTNNTERMRIDSSGNLLVGTTDTTPYNNTSGGGFVVASSGLTSIARETTSSAQTVLHLNNTGVDGLIEEFAKDGTTVGSIGSVAGATTFIDGGAAYSGIQFNATGIVPRDAGVATDNATNIGTSGNRWKDLYLGGGVYLGGTGSANKLDDYEEGTFVPTVTTTSGSVTMSANDDAAYTKIGRQVTVQGRLDVSSVSSPTGNLTIGNLPFAIASLAALSDRSVQYGFITIGSSGTGNPVVCEFVENTSEAVLRTEAWTGAASILTTNSRIQFSWTYFTT